MRLDRLGVKEQLSDDRLNEERLDRVLDRVTGQVHVDVQCVGALDLVLEVRQLR